AGSIVYAQQNESPSFVLDGITSGWEGVSPESISGVTNPTLSVTYGQEYTIRWTNVDGAPHNIALLDSDGNVIQRTQIISETGQTQSITFTTEQSMASQIGQVHTSAMVGKITGGGQGGGGGAGQQTPAGNTTPTVTNETGNETDNLAGNAPNQTTPVQNVSEIEQNPAQTGPLGESYHRFIAPLSPVDGVSSDASGVAYLMVFPSTGGW